MRNAVDTHANLHILYMHPLNPEYRCHYSTMSDWRLSLAQPTYPCTPLSADNKLTNSIFFWKIRFYQMQTIRNRVCQINEFTTTSIKINMRVRTLSAHSRTAYGCIVRCTSIETLPPPPPHNRQTWAVKWDALFSGAFLLINIQSTTNCGFEFWFLVKWMHYWNRFALAWVTAWHTQSDCILSVDRNSL